MATEAFPDWREVRLEDRAAFLKILRLTVAEDEADNVRAEPELAVPHLLRTALCAAQPGEVRVFFRYVAPPHTFLVLADWFGSEGDYLAVSWFSDDPMQSRAERCGCRALVSFSGLWARGLGVADDGSLSEQVRGILEAEITGG